MGAERDGARDLRAFAKANRLTPTPADRKLWRLLRDRRLEGYKFRRQHQIADYIADFVCLEKKLVIELDGEYHGAPEQGELDTKRTAALNASGFRVLRFWNHQVLREGESVWRAILYVLEADA